MRWTLAADARCPNVVAIDGMQAAIHRALRPQVGEESMTKLRMLCRATTVFGKSGDIDETAFRTFLNRFIEADVGIYLCSGGAGQGHTLTYEEQRRVYEIGVSECKGKIPVYGSPPEQHTARSMREHAELAVASGVEMVNIYAPAGWHNFRPTEDELTGYYDNVLSAIKHPVALSAQPLVGYLPKPALIARACRKFPQIVAINLSGVPDSYYIELKELMGRDIDYYIMLPGSLNTLALGAAGMVGPEANIVPKTYRRYLDLYEQGKIQELTETYVELMKLIKYVARWNSSVPRWVKMAMKVLKLPGGEGGLREPYMMPSESELQEFTAGLLKLGVAEINEQARAAGIG